MSQLEVSRRPLNAWFQQYGEYEGASNPILVDQIVPSYWQAESVEVRLRIGEIASNGSRGNRVGICRNMPEGIQRHRDCGRVWLASRAKNRVKTLAQLIDGFLATEPNNVGIGV